MEAENNPQELISLQKDEGKKEIVEADTTESSSKKPIIDTKKKIKLSKTQKVKQKDVKELVEQIKNAKTFMIIDIKGLPSPQFQEIKKKIRGHALIRVAKKNILKRAIEAFEKKSILPLEKEITENCAFAISDLEGFELAGILSQNKTPVYAKTGQETTEDIEVKAGPTSLIPGPAISELGALGLQIAVEEGKISIKVSKVVVKKGGVISEGAASLFQKLDIKPFTIGLEPVAFYDVQSEKIYADIKIDSEQAVEDLRSFSVKALGLAQKIIYYCKETIGYLLAKANADGGVLEKLGPKEEEKKEEKPAEEKKEEASEEKPAETDTKSDNAQDNSSEKQEKSEKSDNKKIESKEELKADTQIKSEGTKNE